VADRPAFSPVVVSGYQVVGVDYRKPKLMLIALGDHQPALQSADVWIAANATLIGRVTLAEASSVWFGAVLRADNEPITIGARTNIQDLAVLHTDPGCPLSIGSDCTVGHQAMLHGCTVGEGSMIGIGAIVLNGAKIGRHCLIGAGALIPEGVEVPDRSLVVGLPGKVKRELTEEEISRLLENAAQYARRAREYRLTAKVIPE
jgi:carbonic anhydrase/acetyltransferase-like protein (isoleucine patch superfamily)